MLRVRKSLQAKRAQDAKRAASAVQLAPPDRKIVVFKAPPGGAIDTSGALQDSQEYTAVDDGKVLIADSMTATGLRWGVTGVASIANEGVGTGEIFDSTIANVAYLRTLLIDPTAGNEGIDIKTAGQEVTIGNTLTGANRPLPGAAVFVTKNGNTLEFRRLLAGSGVTINQNPDDITINSVIAPSVSGFFNDGGGSGLVFETIVGTTVYLRTLQPDPSVGSEGITVTTDPPGFPGQIQIGNTLSATNLGAGAQLFTSKTAGALLQFKSLVGTTPIIATPNANDVTLSLANTAVTAGSYRLTNLTVDTQGRITAAADGGFGNVAMVDSVNGNDGLGALNGRPFLTIGAALTAASAVSGALVYIYPGTYNESVTIPDNVAVRGCSTRSVTIQRTGVAAPTTLVAMGENTRLEDVTLVLSSSANVALTGMSWPGTTSATAKFRTSTLTVTNTGAGVNTTYGIRSTSTSVPDESVSAVRACTIAVTGSGTGATRGLLAGTNAHHFHVRDTNFVASGGGSAVGVESALAGVSITARTSTINGATADITQTAGEIMLASTDLTNATAGGLGFAVATTPTFLTFGDVGQGLANNTTLYFYPGASGTNGNEIQVRIPVKCLVRSLAIKYRLVPALSTRADVYTVRKNGVDTAVTATVTAPGTTSMDEAHSATFLAGDLLSVRVVTGAVGGSPTDTTIVVNMY